MQTGVGFILLVRTICMPCVFFAHQGFFCVSQRLLLSQAIIFGNQAFFEKSPCFGFSKVTQNFFLKKKVFSEVFLLGNLRRSFWFLPMEPFREKLMADCFFAQLFLKLTKWIHFFEVFQKTFCLAEALFFFFTERFIKVADPSVYPQRGTFFLHIIGFFFFSYWI